MYWIDQGEKNTDTVRNTPFSLRRGGGFVHARWLWPILWLIPVSVLSCAANEADYGQQIQPLVKLYCLGCHSTEKHKGDLDLERFQSLDELLKHPKVWQDVVEKLSFEEMPPKEKPQPGAAEREQLIAWVNTALDEAAKARAGDPGPVVLRRLSNAEYKYTLRDLTGVESLDPGREFPTDSASGEGFMNVGNSLVMSPSLLTKYFDAAKDVANHAVLLPTGISFSSSTSPRDWTDEKLAVIRAFYARFTVNGGGTTVDLPGIKFDTKDGGVLPLQKYLEATLSERDALKSRGKTIAQVAREQGLNEKYLATLWSELNNEQPSLVLDQVRAQWRAATPGEVATLTQTVNQWQQALWRFTTIGHIGRRDGPKAWQVPVTPLASSREFRIPLRVPTKLREVTLYLATTDAGDGNENDFAVWENPRLVAPGRPDLALRNLPAVIAAVTAHREKAFASAASCLAAAAESGGTADEKTIARLAQKHRVEPAVLTSWLDCLGIGAGGVPIDSCLTQKLEKVENQDFIKGWVGADALGVFANSSNQAVRIPGNMQPHSVAVHPSPTLRVVVGWRSPVAATLRVAGMLYHAQPECGNGVTWTLELRRGNTRERLAFGVAYGGAVGKFGPLENITVRSGDVISLAVGPRDGFNACDLTAVDFNLNDGKRDWNLAKDVSPDILAGNPHADNFGNARVWSFYTESDMGGDTDSVLPAGSLLAQWQSCTNAREKQRLAVALQELLVSRAVGVGKITPDAVLHRQLASLTGPLLNSLLRRTNLEPAQTSAKKTPGRLVAAVPEWGLDPALFGKHPDGSPVGETSLCVRAPSVIEVRLPADLVRGGEFIATGTLHKETGTEGSVQMHILTTKPVGTQGLVVSAVKQQAAKVNWAEGDQPVISDSPIIVQDGSAARRRFETALADFRRLFPAALCYSKIVPVDEAVTLTLFYREDEHLRRLMLDDTQAAELDQLWAELHFISQDALKQVDALEQLSQYATQDADPGIFAPLHEPIKLRAEAFKKLLVDRQPAQLDAVLKFAGDAYRRPLVAIELEKLRTLYRKLREQEIPHADAIRLTLARVLVSPAFLYRAEQPGPGRQSCPVNDWELATRLSYFLWSSIPDAELRELAVNGRLHQPEVLAAQSRRMIRDPRVRRLATEFACAWLHIYDFESFDEKSERHFPTFAALRGPMYEEAIRFFTDAFQNDASVLTFFDANHTFLNQALAEHYAIPGVTGDDWRRVNGVKQFGRGGILGMGATLAKQSGASRTSPILRGNWVAEVLLGDKLPRPPKDVPRLPEDEAKETLTVRELTMKHTSDTRCAGCHKRIDGYGYALESYDAIGRRRTRDLADRPIDTHGKLFDGTEVDGADDLRNYLLTQKREVVLNQFCRKLLGYALGRSVMLSDRPLLAEMQTQLSENDYRFSTALDTIVRSKQFREIRGKEMADEE